MRIKDAANIVRMVQGMQLVNMPNEECPRCHGTGCIYYPTTKQKTMRSQPESGSPGCGISVHKEDWKAFGKPKTRQEWDQAIKKDLAGSAVAHKKSMSRRYE